MPNWCSNTLAIHGPTEAVEKFIEDNKGIEIGTGEDTTSAGDVIETPLSFNRAAPTPDQSRFTDHDYRATKDEPDYWYNWNVDNWGTKWDLGDETYVEKHDNDDGTSMVVYSFDTAWAPPTGWLGTVAPNYPNLNMKIEYREEGMGFAGIMGFHRGEEVENQYWEQSFHSDVDTYDEIYGGA